MKIFKDLEFRPHLTGKGLHAVMLFENGYGVSVVRFRIGGTYGSFTDNENEWELAIVKKAKDGFDLVFDSGISDDVLGHLSEKDVTDVMRKVQEL
jgi:hypothetical protein